MERNAKVYVAGHTGLVGSAIVRKLLVEGYINIITRTHEQLDLTHQPAVCDFFANEKPEYVFMAASLVGGIRANNMRRAEFFYQNMQMQLNVIDSAYRSGVKKLLFLGSNCIYPKTARQPMHEECLLTGPFEPTNEPYAIAKVAGIKMCESYNRQYGTRFIAVIPANIFGPGDHFNGQGHVISALIDKFYKAKVNGSTEATLWGSGTPLREFLFADDAGEGIVYVMNNFHPTDKQIEVGDIFMNIGSGIELSVSELALIVADRVEFSGKILWDKTKLDGVQRKLLDSSKIKELGWRPKIGLCEGLKQTYDWYLANIIN